jgi:predicted nuclease of predicted toxin-antitoxin system
MPTQLKFLLDESADFQIALKLREKGFEVIAIVEESPSEVDSFVLERAFRENAFLITEDKDFGELVRRFGYPHHGVLLIRLPEYKPWPKAEYVALMIDLHFQEMKNHFSVLKHENLRIKR